MRSVVTVLFARVGALGLVVAADAEVALCRVVLVVADAQRLVLGDRVVEARRRRSRCRAAAAARSASDRVPSGSRDVQVRRLERVDAVQREVERRALLDQRSRRSCCRSSACRSGPFPRRERAAAAQRAVAQVVAAAAAQRADARLRDDVDEQPAGAVVLRGERVAGDVDRLDLRLRRQLAALEAVDAHAQRRRPAMSCSCCAISVGIVRQRVDLLARERGAERAAAAIGRRFLLVAADGHRVLQPLDRQHDHLLVVVGGADAHVLEDAGLEAGKLRLDEIPPGRQRDRRDALIRRLAPDRASPLSSASSRPVTVTVAPGRTAPRLVDHGHEQRPSRGGACAKSGEAQRRRRGGPTAASRRRIISGPRISSDRSSC